MLETELISKPSLRPGYVVKEALVSRITKIHVPVSLELNQVPKPLVNVENTSSMAEKNASEVVIMGIKKKQTATEKSGKRLKSGLERATSRRKTKLNKSFPKTCENDAPVACPSLMPVSQPSQAANWIQPSWLTSFPRVDSASTLLQPSQVANQNIPQQVSSQSGYGSIYQQQLQTHSQVFLQQQLQTLNQQDQLNGREF